MKSVAKVYLSRRNLESLLKKLDRPGSQCTIVKSDTVHPTCPLVGVDELWVEAVEDKDYYTDREPGIMYEDVFHS